MAETFTHEMNLMELFMELINSEWMFLLSMMKLTFVWSFSKMLLILFVSFVISLICSILR